MCHHQHLVLKNWINGVHQSRSRSIALKCLSFAWEPAFACLHDFVVLETEWPLWPNRWAARECCGSSGICTTTVARETCGWTRLPSPWRSTCPSSFVNMSAVAREPQLDASSSSKVVYSNVTNCHKKRYDWRIHPSHLLFTWRQRAVDFSGFGWSCSVAVESCIDE